jgi:hypothetical protein
MRQLHWRARAQRGGGWSYLCSVGLIACAGKAGSDERYERQQHDLSSADADPAALSANASCASLLDYLKRDLSAQLKQRAEQARQGQSYYSGITDLGADTQAPATSTAALSAASPASPASSSFSDTTVQTPGVDEPDFVKAEGDRIYLLQGQALFVINAWPADATEVLGSSTAIEGTPSGLFVEDGKVVVLSSVYGPLAGSEEATSPYYYYYPQYTKLTVFDVATGTPLILRESYVEGYAVAARRHGSVVRTLVQHGVKGALDYPSVSYANFLGHPYSQSEIDEQVDLWVELATDSIEHASIEDFLPAAYERIAGELIEQPLRCAEYLLPAPGLTQAGSSSILGLDLADVDAPLHSTTVLGQADRLYANDEAVLVTQADYRYYTAQSPSYQTHIHRFDLLGADANYVASGTIDGLIQSQFALDESDGIVRLATTDASFAIPVPLASTDAGAPPLPPAPSSRVLTLGIDGQRLVELGRSSDFGPNEQVYAARFFGDRAYVSTYRQIDPLSVVDLSDPRAPKVLGQLDVPGYSNFLFPLPNHQLFSIGQDTDARGASLGLALKLFDVSDPSAPALAQEYIYPSTTTSEASADFHALTFHPDRDLVTFPLQNYSTGASTLEVFQVSSSAGMTRVGGIAAVTRQLTPSECLILLGYPQDPSYLAALQQDAASYQAILAQCGYYQESFRRGLFRADDVFAITTERVAAYALDQLQGPPLGQADLPVSYYYGGYYYPVSVPPSALGGAAGAAGAAGSASMPEPEQGPQVGAAGSADAADAGPGAGGAPAN